MDTWTLALTWPDPPLPLDFEGRYYFPGIPVLDISCQDYLAQAGAAASLVEFLLVVRGYGGYAG
jgi:hypothetical protein